METRAYTDENVSLICPTTKLPYAPTRTLIEVVGNTRFAMAACRWCDARGHTRMQTDFDPSNPQIHTHILPGDTTRTP